MVKSHDYRITKQLKLIRNNYIIHLGLIELYDITIVPLTVTIGNQDYLERINLAPKEFFYENVFY